MTVEVRTDLAGLAERLRAHPSIRSKIGIGRAAAGLGLSMQSPGQPRDDAAALPNGTGWDLFAGEGFIPAFVENDPWFAGWCGVMVNLSDIAAMGGRATALIDQVWAPSAEIAAPLLKGLRDASTAYGVPLVGGHTNFGAPSLGLAVSVLGKADQLVTSFSAGPGDLLIAAIDTRGRYVNFDNYCAALEAPSERLRDDLELLPRLADLGLARAGKDISQGGIIGTALMLAECSKVAISLDLPAVLPPDGVALERWLRSFPSFGYLLSISPAYADRVKALFAARDIDAQVIGRVHSGSALSLCEGGNSALFWDHAATPYLDLGGPHA